MRTTAITPVASLSVCAIVRFLRVLNRINRSFSFFLSFSLFSSLLSIIFPGKSLSILNPNDVEKNVSFSQFYNSC